MEVDVRTMRMKQTVSEAVRVWRTRQETEAGTDKERDTPLPIEEVLQSIPRREQAVPPDERKLWIPYVESARIHVSIGRSVMRLFTWLRVMLLIWFGNLSDQVLQRDTIKRRAVRFREVLERAGGTFIKVGQQMAMRVDLLPWAYCVELSKMLDRMAPFAVEEALETV